jgi:hypothetical protein
MSLSCVRSLTLCLLAGMFAGFSGCKSNTAQAASGGSADMSGPPTFNDFFQARNPRVCRTVTAPPTPEEARALVQCAWEGKSIMSGFSASLGLVTDLQVQMSKPRPFKMEFVNPAGVDTSGMVYDLRGQGTSWTCSPAKGIYAPGQNCARTDAVPKGIGECWHTTFGDWKCEMTVGGGTYSNRLAGPKDY